MFTRETTTPGTSPSSISWSMRANVIVNSYAEKVTFAKFAYTPAICSGSRWMLSWRSWGSSSTAPRYYGRGKRLQLPPLPVRRHSAAGGGHRRSAWLPRCAPRDVAAVGLPLRGHGVADRPRQRAAKRRVAATHDRSRARGDHYLCLHRLARRRGDCTRRAGRRVG